MPCICVCIEQHHTRLLLSFPGATRWAFSFRGERSCKIFVIFCFGHFPAAFGFRQPQLQEGVFFCTSRPRTVLPDKIGTMRRGPKPHTYS